MAERWYNKHIRCTCDKKGVKIPVSGIVRSIILVAVVIIITLAVIADVAIKGDDMPVWIYLPGILIVTFGTAMLVWNRIYQKRGHTKLCARRLAIAKALAGNPIGG